MPRNPRESYDSSYFHIMCQGINKEYIFNENYLKEKYKSLMLKFAEENNVNILSYCIMDNHVHILVYVDNTRNMSDFMHSLNANYAEYYNWKKDRKGYVFRDRYKSEVITSLSYLRNCMVYIHKNPVVGKIVDKMEKYKYSSYNDFIQNKGICTDKNLKLLFGIQKNYVDIFNELHNRENEHNFIDGELSKDEIKDIIKDILKEYVVKISEVSLHKELMERVVLDIKIRTRISNTEIANIIGVNRMKVQRIINKYLKKEDSEKQLEIT